MSLAGFTHREVINNVSEAHRLQKFMLNAEQRQRAEAILRCFITKFIFDALQFRERLFFCAVGNQHAEINFQDISPGDIAVSFYKNPSFLSISL